MSIEEKMRLAAILGHEAYRDGYGTGDFAGLKEASIARILMGDRINQDYGWFYQYNRDFAFESYLLGISSITGNYTMFDDYLHIFYNNDRDYFFQTIDTRGEFQNQYESYRTIPLLDALDEANRINEERLRRAFSLYFGSFFKEEEFLSQINSIDMESFYNDQWNIFINDTGLQKDHGYERIAFESIYLHGCMFMSTKYGVEAVTGLEINTTEFNKYLYDNKYYRIGANLSDQLMVDIMNSYSNGEYLVTLAETGLPDISTLYKYNQSDDMYIAHLRIKKEGTGAGYHSVMVSSIDFYYDEGEIKIKTVNVANPWNGSSFSGRQSYILEQIDRWDIFRITYQTRR
jgi:hypothetical protein